MQLRRPVQADTCVACGGHPARAGLTRCTACLFAMAGEANAIYDAVRKANPALDPKVDGDKITAIVAGWLEAGHRDHTSPRMACPYCIVT